MIDARFLLIRITLASKIILSNLSHLYSSTGLRENTETSFDTAFICYCIRLLMILLLFGDVVGLSKIEIHLGWVYSSL